MKVLIVTGKLAERMVREYASEADVDFEVVAMPIGVAAFLTAEYIAKKLSEKDLRGFDVIIVPGLVRGDVSIIAKATGIPTLKGPRHAADVPLMLSLLGEVEFSPVEPADTIMRKEIAKRVRALLEEVESKASEFLGRPGNLLVGSLPVGPDFPPRVVAEILNVPALDNNALFKVARRYVKEGADIVDIGMVAGAPDPRCAADAIKLLKRELSVPVSVDSLEPNEIEAAVSAGADLVISLDAGNIDDVAPKLPSDVAVVVIPTDCKSGYHPKSAREKVDNLVSNIERARAYGLKKIIADPILEPPNTGLIESLVAYFEFSRKCPDIPLLMGVGNVTELIDADSVGVNASLASIAAEVKAALLLTTEGSRKTVGAVRELATAAKMAFLARLRGTVPKDLGLDLLILKEKRGRELPYDRALERYATVVTARAAGEPPPDPAGFFKILVDREEGLIVAAHYKRGQEEPDVVIKGRTALEVRDGILKLGLITRHDHAFYLGIELAKAEEALRTGRSYVQDEPLFKGPQN